MHTQCIPRPSRELPCHRQMRAFSATTGGAIEFGADLSRQFCWVNQAIRLRDQQQQVSPVNRLTSSREAVARSLGRASRRHVGRSHTTHQGLNHSGVERPPGHQTERGRSKALPPVSLQNPVPDIPDGECWLFDSEATQPHHDVINRDRQFISTALDPPAGVWDKNEFASSGPYGEGMRAIHWRITGSVPPSRSASKPKRVQWHRATSSCSATVDAQSACNSLPSGSAPSTVQLSQHRPTRCPHIKQSRAHRLRPKSAVRRTTLSNSVEPLPMS